MRVSWPWLNLGRTSASHHRLALCLFAAGILSPIAVPNAHGIPPRNQAAKQSPPPLVTPSTFPASGIQEEVIGKITPGNEPGDAVSVGNHLAWIEKLGDYRLVFLDGKQQPGQYAKVPYLFLSDDGIHSAFVAELSGRQYLILSGEVRSSEYPRISSFHLDPQAGYYVLGGCTREGCRMVVNGKEVGPAYEDIRDPVFTTDRGHYFFLGVRDNQCFLVRDGQEQGPKMDDCKNLSISPDGQHTAVAALLKSKWSWIVDGAPGPAFPVIGSLDLTADWRRYTYAGVRATLAGRFLPRVGIEGAVVVDGKVIASYEGLGFAQAERLPGVAPILFAGPDGVSDPFFLEDGRLVYAARRGKNDFAVFVDGVPGPSFEFLSGLIAVAQHGKHIAYVGFRSGSFVEVLDQRPGRSIPQQLRGEFSGGVVLSDDAAHIGFWLATRGYYIETGTPQRGKRHMVVDGQAGPTYDALEIRNFQFSSDGQHHAYLVSGAKGDRDLVVFDGLASPLYDNVIHRSLRFLT